MTIKASDIAKLLQDSGTGEVFIEMDPAEVEMDTGHHDLKALADSCGYVPGGTASRDSRVGQIFHPKPEA